MIIRIVRMLQAWPRWLVITISLVLIAVIGMLDFAAGIEFNLAALYLVPIAMVTWTVGTRWTAPVAAIASGTILAADYAAGVRYAEALAPIWNTGSRFIVFLIVSRVVAYLHQTATRAASIARTDELTGIGNLRFFREAAALEIARAQRYRQPFTIAFIDIDNFKEINDTFGHEAGDRALQVFGQVLAQHIRNTDSVARFGGDEFVVLFPIMPADQATTVLELLQKRLQQNQEHTVTSLTCSIGAVTFEIPPVSVDVMLKLADERMYAAKQSGKDMIQHSAITEQADLTTVAREAIRSSA